MLELIETEKVDELFGVPTMFAALLEHPRLRFARPCPR